MLDKLYLSWGLNSVRYFLKSQNWRVCNDIIYAFEFLLWPSHFLIFFFVRSFEVELLIVLNNTAAKILQRTLSVRFHEFTDD